MGWVRDSILYIKRCVSQDWAGDIENTGPAAECAAGPVFGLVQILRRCKQGKRPEEYQSISVFGFKRKIPSRFADKM